jgi:hypothetical protein
MARKPNYDYEKRRKEMERKAKKDSRREEKRLRREQNDGEGGAPIEAMPMDDLATPSAPEDAEPTPGSQ